MFAMRPMIFPVILLAAPAAFAGSYDFVPAPQTDLNRVYRIDRFTGEVSACQYGLKEGSIGVTLCYGSGEGAQAQPPGEYGLVASRHEREGGVFRVNQRSGQMSVCYVFEEHVVCTPQSGALTGQQSQLTPSPESMASIAPASPGGAQQPAIPAKRN